MNHPCEGCAYTRGAAANTEPQNNIKAQLCLLGGIAFWCHHAVDGSIQDLSDVKSPMKLREGVQSGRITICQGWRRETRRLAETGWFSRGLRLKRVIAKLGIGALQIFISTDDKERKEEAAKTCEASILWLNRERGYTEVKGGR